MIGKIISALVAIYLVVGVIYAIVWGHVGAMFSSLFALDFAGFFMSLLRCVFVIFLWLLMTAGKLAIPF